MSIPCCSALYASRTFVSLQNKEELSNELSTLTHQIFFVEVDEEISAVFS